jgi:hypothetical protein
MRREEKRHVLVRGHEHASVDEDMRRNVRFMEGYLSSGPVAVVAIASRPALPLRF